MLFLLIYFSLQIWSHIWYFAMYAQSSFLCSFYVSLHSLKAPFFFLSKIFPLLEVDELSFCVHKFIFLQLCYFLLFKVVSELCCFFFFFFTYFRLCNANVFFLSLTLNLFHSVTRAGISLTCMFFS